MRIGIYGGSFNPVHNGHGAIVNQVLNQKLVDELWLMPCRDHAFNKNLESIEHRIKMLEYTFGETKDVYIDYTEANYKSDSKSYTADTLRTLKKKYNHKFYFIIGSDALNEIDNWYDSNYLKKNLKFIAVDRKGYNLKNIDGVKLETIINPINDLSSSMIRDRVSSGESISGMVNSNVEEYIYKNNLYINKKEYKNPASVVDMIVNYNDGHTNGIVLIKRKHPPFKDYWALPGGYLENGKETLEEAAIRELSEETSLKTDPTKIELIGVYSDPKRDPRGHVITHVYEIKDFSGIPIAADDAKEIGIFKTLPENLAFDHERILREYRNRLEK